MNDEIGNSLGLIPLDDVIDVKSIVKRVSPKKEELDNKHDLDYEYARTNFYNVIESGTEALEQMLEVAKASEHPRAYEVVATIMKTLIDSNKELVAMSSKKVKDDEIVPESNKPVTNNTAIFVGSTTELQKYINNSLKFDSREESGIHISDRLDTK
jgi:hypothetical protein